MTAGVRKFLLGAVATAILLAGPVQAQEGAGTDEDEVFDIYMVVWRGETDVERGFQSYLRERGIRANVTILNLDRDRSKIPEFVEEIRAAEPDLVHTWGTSTGLGIFGPRTDAEPGKHLEGVPGLFSLVAYPIAAGLVKSLEDPGRALSGTAYLPPLRSQIDAILAYLPVKRFGMISNPLERNSQINVEEMRTVSEEMGFGLVQLEVPLDSEGRPDPDTLPAWCANSANRVSIFCTSVLIPLSASTRRRSPRKLSATEFRALRAPNSDSTGPRHCSVSSAAIFSSASWPVCRQSGC